MHIGRLSARMTPGNFVLDDVVIEGLTPDARPFVRATRIAVHVPWWTLFQRQLVVDVRMTDWTMTIEQWPDGHHSFPRIGGDGGIAAKLPLHDDGELRLCRSRRVHLRGPRHALERGRAQPQRRCRAARRTCWASSDRSTSGARGSPTARCRSRASCRCARTWARRSWSRKGGQAPPHRSGDRRRGVAPDGRRRHRLAMAGADLSGRIAPRLQADARALLRARVLAAVRGRAIQRHLPPLQRRARAEGRVLERARGAGRPALSESPRLARLAARSIRRARMRRRISSTAAARSGITWRTSALRTARTRRSTRTTRSSTSARSADMRTSARWIWRAARADTSASPGRTATFTTRTSPPARPRRRRRTGAAWPTRELPQPALIVLPDEGPFNDHKPVPHAAHRRVARLPHRSHGD